MTSELFLRRRSPWTKRSLLLFYPGPEAVITSRYRYVCMYKHTSDYLRYKCHKVSETFLFFAYFGRSLLEIEYVQLCFTCLWTCYLSIYRTIYMLFADIFWTTMLYCTIVITLISGSLEKSTYCSCPGFWASAFPSTFWTRVWCTDWRWPWWPGRPAGSPGRGRGWRCCQRGRKTWRREQDCSEDCNTNKKSWARC